MPLHTSRSENRADSVGYASMAADHETDVFRMNPQFEDNHRLPLGLPEPALPQDGPQVSLRSPLAAPPGDRPANARIPQRAPTKAIGSLRGQSTSAKN